MSNNFLKFSKPPSRLLRSYLDRLLNCIPHRLAAEQYALFACPQRFLLRLDYGRAGEQTWVEFDPVIQAPHWVMLPEGLIYMGRRFDRAELQQLSRLVHVLQQTEQITLSGRWAGKQSFSAIQYMDIAADRCDLTLWDGARGHWDFTYRRINWEFTDKYRGTHGVQ